MLLNTKKLYCQVALALTAISLLASTYKSLPAFASPESISQVPAEVPGVELGAPNNRQSPNRGHFSLAILQDRPLLSQAIARVSIKSKRVNGFLGERFIGDFLYGINQRARFVRGSNPEDRVVVRLFDLQNQLIGYSEFELLSENAIANLVLPSQLDVYGTVRTVVGIDANQDGAIDRNVNVYDYFTRLDLLFRPSLDDSTATFLADAPNLDLFRVAGLPNPRRNPFYPDTFVNGSFPLEKQSVRVFEPELPSTLIVLPGQLVPSIGINRNNSSVYEITRQILSYSEVKLNQVQNTIFQENPK